MNDYDWKNRVVGATLHDLRGWSTMNAVETTNTFETPRGAVEVVTVATFWPATERPDAEPPYVTATACARAQGSFDATGGYVTVALPHNPFTCLDVACAACHGLNEVKVIEAWGDAPIEVSAETLEDAIKAFAAAVEARLVARFGELVGA